MTIFQEAIKLVHSGKLGRITSATCWIGVNGQRVGMNPGPGPRRARLGDVAGAGALGPVLAGTPVTGSWAATTTPAAES